MKFLTYCLLGICLSGQLLAQKANYVEIASTDTEADIIRKAANVVPTDRQLRWQQLELTAFFHFGINTFTGKEWGTGKEDPQIFNPTALNAEQWVRSVKDAGFKQVIITAKHHDGFCLWPTKTTAHSVKSSPWLAGNGDVVKEVSRACKKLNVGFGVYLSPWDMNAPMYGSDAYNNFFVEQLTELLTWYGKVDEVWFDGANGEGPNGKKQVYDFEKWYALIRKLQPQAVIAIMGPDVRWVGTETGRGRAMEWSVVPSANLDQGAIADGSQKNLVVKPQGDMRGSDIGSRDKIRNAKALVWYPAETDVSIRPGWFYHASQDKQVKTPQKLNEIYFTSVGMNSVLLLNIPPDKRGLISDADISSLQQWTAMRRLTFSKNFLRKARVTCSNGLKLKKALDGNYNSYLTTKDADTATTIVFELKHKARFNVLSLQEAITVGQRVEKFTAYYEDKGAWKQFTSGTTIGYKRLLQFPAITANKIKIDIEASRLNPTIAEAGLYYDAN
ncbi:alpha-L-fucosidase [Niabella insulamsoli]|uniref:alpha-L-fucosidase n=1 Tax=Niabella insulamsoli TaxID=3144874 RepID=UPI0031FC5709